MSKVVSRSRFAILAGMAVLALAGCQAPPVPGVNFRDDSKPFVTVEKIPGSKIGAMRKPFRMSGGGYTPDKLDHFKAKLAGNTILSWDGKHGTQVEYLAPGGRTYLWYAGNLAVVTGTWSLRNREMPEWGGGSYQMPEICYAYAGATYNPVTKKSGGLECSELSHLSIFINEMAPGDPFRLSSGKVPFVLDKRSATLDALYARKTGG